MTLVLQIENYTSLENGGPVEFTVPAHGAKIGRSASMDWTLPDATRHISSHHFDIVVQHGAYYLRDSSTNGTFLRGSRYRLEGMHQINNGDQFQVGSYFIKAMMPVAQNTGLQTPTFTDPPQPEAAPIAAQAPAAPVTPPVAPSAAPAAQVATPEPAAPAAWTPPPTAQPLAQTPPPAAQAPEPFDPWNTGPVPGVASEPDPVPEPEPEPSSQALAAPIESDPFANPTPAPQIPDDPFELSLPPTADDNIPPVDLIGEDFDEPLLPPDATADPELGRLSDPEPSAETDSLKSPPSAASGDLGSPGQLKTPTLASFGDTTDLKLPGYTTPPQDNIDSLLPTDLSIPPSQLDAATDGLEAAPRFDTQDATPELSVPPTAEIPVAAVPSVPRPDLGLLDKTQFPATDPAPAAPEPEPFIDAEPVAEPQPAAVAPAPAESGDPNTFLRAFLEGAELNPDEYDSIDTEALARALGETTRAMASELMMMLQARAEVKKHTRSSPRTMQSSADNNPLKFMPDTKQAIETLYLKPRPGFQQGAHGVGAALEDVRLHQAAIFAAIQPALAGMLEGLSPEEIDGGHAGGGLLGPGGRGKAWDSFVKLWERKSQHHENGMQGEFLKHYASAYAELVEDDGF